uniref:E3 ubiquitin-protein ligase makorin-1-like isoform X3 n=2 Tax=Pristiophorus japonicus TaxID=55135 RepID=UPI00398EEE99
MQKSSQICRHFSNGFCFYGNHCRYQHISPTVRWSSRSRRGSAPALQLTTAESSRSYHGVESSDRTGGGNRRSSAPAIQRMPAGFSQPSHAVGCTVHSTTAKATWGRRGSEPAVSSFPHFGRNTERFGMHLEEEVAEDKENETPSKCSERWELDAEFMPQQFQEHDCAPTSRAADPFHFMSREACSCVNSIPQTDFERASSASQSATKKKWTENLAVEMSKDVICGICMDTVYEKTPAKDRCFAILPGCNHAFCVTCIKKWRNSKGFTSNIIKACPECRVVSSYFIPHRYWVVDEQKQKLIDKFKAEKRKIRCKFFLRSNGRCPFKSECIYLHEFPEGYRPTQHKPRRRSNPPPLGIMWEDYDDDDDEDDDYDHTLRLLGILSLDDSFLENLVQFQYELFDSDLSDFNPDCDDSDD